jgi:hypothetical protein
VAAAREIRRVLRPAGRVALSVNRSLEDNPVYDALFQTVARHLGTTAAVIATPFALGGADDLGAALRAAGFLRVEVAPTTLAVRFPAPARFVQLTVLSSAAVLPVFARMDTAARTALVEAVARDMEPALRPYITDDAVAFPLAIHIGLAHL